MSITRKVKKPEKTRGNEIVDVHRLYAHIRGDAFACTRLHTGYSGLDDGCVRDRDATDRKPERHCISFEQFNNNNNHTEK